MRRDSQSRLAINITFREIDVAVWRRIQNFDVYLLLWAWTDIGGDDDKCMGVCGVPNAPWDGRAGCLKGEFNGMREGGKDCEESEEGDNCYSCH